MTTNLSMKQPEMTAQERIERANAAAGVTQQAKPVTQVVKKPAQQLRPWEKLGHSGGGVKRRLPVEMSNALRSKLEYLESVSPKRESKSQIASLGILAECRRIEQMHGLLPEQDAELVRARVLDPKESVIEGASRMVLMVMPHLHERLEALKQMRVIKTFTEVALAGIEDECNRRLQERREL